MKKIAFVICGIVALLGLLGLIGTAGAIENGAGVETVRIIFWLFVFAAGGCGVNHFGSAVFE